MMKSFFKKLAFVMALAMVVTLAAPAAQASAATALGIALQSAASKEEVKTADNVEVGATVDYKYYYAPKNYLELNPTWESSNTAVATVTQKGEVTGVADGVAVIIIKLDNGQVGTMEVTVGKGEVPTNGFEAKQTTENDVQLTFNNKAITKDEIAANLKMFYLVSGYEVEVQLIKSIGDVKDGVVTVELYGTINDGSEYVFQYKDEKAGFTGKIGAVASVEVKVNKGKYVGDDIELGVICKNADGIDITAVVNNSNAYITYKEVGTPAANNEYWLSDNVLYFTTEYAAYVAAEYHGFDKDNNELPVITSEPFSVTATNKPPYTLNFNATAAWSIANTVDWKNVNKDIAVGDDDMGYTLFIKTKEAYTDAEVEFPAGTSEGTFRYVSTKPSVLYVTEGTGLMMPNSEGSASVLLYFTPNNGAETLVTVVPVKVSAARSVKNVALDTSAASVSTVAGYNTATFKFTLKDNLNVAFAGAEVAVKCTTTTKFTGTPKVEVSGKSNEKGEVTVKVTVDDTMVADAGSQTYWFEASVNGIVKKFSVLVKDPKGTAGSYQNLSYGLAFGGNKEVKVENANALVLTANLAVLSNGAAVGNQKLAGAKVDIKNATVGDFYYEVKFNNNDITKNVTTSASNSVLNMALTKTASESGMQVVDYSAGVGTYTVTIYKAMAKAGQTTPAYYATVKTLVQEVKATQPALKLVAKTTNETTEREPEAIVANCFKFQYDGKDIDLNSDDYKLVVDTNEVNGASICYINSVTIYKKVGDNTYVKYNVNINDYVTLK